MKRILTIIMLIICVSCSDKTLIGTNEEIRETIDSDDHVTASSNPKTELIQQEGINDPMSFLNSRHGPAKEVENNVFMLSGEGGIAYYINFNTYSKITKVEDYDKNLYPIIIDFKNMTLSVDNCIYSYQDGLNNDDSCSKFNSLENESIAKQSFRIFLSEFLFDVHEEYWNDQYEFFENEQSENFSDVFTQEVLNQYSQEIVRAAEEYYDLDSTIGNDEYKVKIVEK